MTLQMGSGAALGFITGYAIKKVLQAVMIIVGVFVAGLLSLEASGSITIHWNSLFGSANMGATKVADYLASTGSIAFAHFPITSGFGLGFIYALRK